MFGTLAQMSGCSSFDPAVSIDVSLESDAVKKSCAVSRLVTWEYADGLVGHRGISLQVLFDLLPYDEWELYNYQDMN